MPKIINRTGDPVRTAVVKGPRARPEAVGAGISTQLGNIMGAVQIGTKIAGMGADRTRAINTTEAEEGVVKFERAKNELFFNPENGYFNTQGKSAYDTSEDANKSLQKLAREYAAGMSNPGARQMFMNVANKHITSGQSDIMRHASKGIKAWEISTIKAQTENTIENASLFRGDPERLSVQRELGRESIRDAAKLEGDTGISLNERLQTYDSAFASATIDASIIDNAAAGKESLDKYGSMLEGAEKQKFEEKIRKKQESEKTQIDAQQSVAAATSIVSANDGDRSAVLKDISKIEDPEMQSKTRKEAMYQVNQIETAKSEERNSIVDDVGKFEGSVEAYKAAHREKWVKLSHGQQKQLEKGEPVVTDFNVLHEFNSKSITEIGNMKSSEIEKTVLELDESDRNKVYTLWRKARDGRVGSSEKTENRLGQTNNALSTTTVEQIMGKKKREWGVKDLKKTNLLYEMLNARLQNEKDSLKRPLTTTEFSNTLNDFQREVVLNNPWFSGPRLELVEGSDRDQIVDHLKSIGVSDPSEEVIMEAYRQATGR